MVRDVEDKNPAPQVVNSYIENRMSNAAEGHDYRIALNNNVWKYDGVHVIFTDYGIIVRGYRTEEELEQLALDNPGI